MIAGLIFLGFQMFMNREPQDTRTSAKILESIRSENSKINDHSINTELTKLNAALSEDEKKAANEKDPAARRILEDTILRKRVEGQLLAADAAYKAGIQRNDFNRLNTAYITLRGTHKQYLGKPIWKDQQFEIPATLTGSFPAKTVTGESFYNELVNELTKRSQKDLVWGLVPGYQLIDYLVNLTGAVAGFSYAFAALLLAFVVRALVFPLTQKQYRWGRQMAQLQPLMKELKAQYTDKKTGQIKDMQEFNQRSMAMYKEYGLNPMAGCLPMLIQMPFFLMVYQCMVHYRFEFQKGTFLWINPGNAGSTWIAPNLGETDYLLIVIYMISMVTTTLMTPVSDPSNAKQQKMIGVGVAVLFSIMMFFYPLPSAFVLYWVFTNIFATAQMVWVYRQPVEPLVKVNAPGGGVFPTDPTPNGTPKNGQSVKTGVPVRHKPKSKKK
ncbi:MAG: membrane protein insertase YidC [Fimbriimonadaceae bacterium]|nr:membrane protein insertase YidC [Fimbriimonadaceae bacterium]